MGRKSERKAKEETDKEKGRVTKSKSKEPYQTNGDDMLRLVAVAL